MVTKLLLRHYSHLGRYMAYHRCFKDLPSRDDEGQVLAISDLWNTAMAHPNDPQFIDLDIFWVSYYWIIHHKHGGICRKGCSSRDHSFIGRASKRTIDLGGIKSGSASTRAFGNIWWYIPCRGKSRRSSWTFHAVGTKFPWDCITRFYQFVVRWLS